MTGLFDRLGSAFIAPPHTASSRDSGSRRRDGDGGGGRHDAIPGDPRGGTRTGSAAIAMLCRPDDALVIGGAVALLLAGRCRTSHALVALWAGRDAGSVRAPATAGARRLAATLEARGHEATATGRLAVVRLGGGLMEAAPEAVRAVAASGDVPAVVVLAGPRDDAADALLRDQDGVLIAVPEETDAAVPELALAGLAPLGVEACALPIPLVPSPARVLAASGVAVMPPLRAAVEAGLASLLGEERR